MFAVSPQSYHFSYVPKISSPLSPCNANARPHCFPLSPPMSPSPCQKRNTPAVRRRAVKPNPLLQMQEKEKGKARRRDAFFRKVREGGEERKWEARGEQALRMDFISRQKQWEAEQARIAAESTEVLEDDEMALQELEDDIVEQVLSQEDQELQALVSLMEGQNEQALPQTESHTEYGSDDDDYDNIFMEALNVYDAQAQHDGTKNQAGQDQEMDMSNG